MTSTALLTALVGVLLGLVAGVYVARRWLWPGEDPSAELAADRALVSDGLDRLQSQLRELEHERASWQGQLAAQFTEMRSSTEMLRQETSSLSTALRKPQVRGRWGELHLRRCVELAGLVAHCDFAEQQTIEADDDGTGRRPDLVVRLSGGRDIVVDAKVPLDAFLDATHADSDPERDAHLERHLRQVRRHVDQLSSKRYWQGLRDTPELVVLFLPAESFLVAALENQSDLLAHAAERNVVLATPMTLIALLRTVAHDWRQQAVAEQALQIHRLGMDLHRRIGTMGGHLDQLGHSLNKAVAQFNSAVGSWESRVLVAARRFDELSDSTPGLESPRSVTEQVRGQAPRGTETAPAPTQWDRRAAPDEGDDGPTVAV